MIFDEPPFSFWGKRRNSSNAVSHLHQARTSAGAVQLRGTSARKDIRLKLKRLEEALKDEGFDLATELVRVLKEGTLDEEVRARLMLTLVEFREPKLKATTITVNNRPVGELTEAELRELAGIIDQEPSGAGVAGAARSAVLPFRLRAADEPVSDAIEAPRLPAE